MTNPEGEVRSSIIKSKTGITVDETVGYIVNLVKFLEPNLSVFFNEMVCDFIKDDSGLWWMIGVRAFKLDKNLNAPTFGAFIENCDI